MGDLPPPHSQMPKIVSVELRFPPKISQETTAPLFGAQWLSKNLPILSHLYYYALINKAWKFELTRTREGEGEGGLRVLLLLQLANRGGVV